MPYVNVKVGGTLTREQKEKLSAAITMPRGDRTLEDVVRELLRPLLQQWLDDNLPGIVQQTVEAEVERIARGRVR